MFPDFKDYNKRIRQPGGFRLPLPATERVWNTPSGKAEFLIYEGLNEDPEEVGEGVLRLTTIRSHDQYNTTIYGNNDRYRGVFGRRDVVFMSKEDLAEHKLEHGDIVDIETALPNGERNRLEGFTVIAYDIARGSVAAYYPEANGLVPLSYHDEQQRHAFVQVSAGQDHTARRVSGALRDDLARRLWLARRSAAEV